MGKKEKLVDLKPKVDKISEEHLKELQEIVNVINYYTGSEISGTISIS